MTDKTEKKAAPFKRCTRAHWCQSLLAAVFVLVAFLLMDALKSRLVVASLGASTAIAFSFPNTQSARARFLIGGYCTGIVSGCFGWWLTHVLEGSQGFPLPARVVGCALAVFLTVFLMTTLNVEHPPSAALSVAIVTGEAPLAMSAAAMAGILALCLLKHALKGKLVNL